MMDEVSAWFSLPVDEPITKFQAYSDLSETGSLQFINDTMGNDAYRLSLKITPCTNYLNLTKIKIN